MNLQRELRAGIEALGLTLHQSQIDQLIEYLYLLQKWNQHYNLTAISELDRMLSHHVFDSLSIMRALDRGMKAMDVGSGAGLPGIPLAIAMPDTVWVMLDSSAKKTRFIQQAIAHCGIRNAQVVHARVQDYHAPDSLDFIVSRAYASLAEFCESVSHLLDSRTQLLTMKAGLKQKEKQALDESRFKIDELKLEVPGIREPRSLVKITPI